MRVRRGWRCRMMTRGIIRWLRVRRRVVRRGDSELGDMVVWKLRYTWRRLEIRRSIVICKCIVCCTVLIRIRDPVQFVQYIVPHRH